MLLGVGRILITALMALTTNLGSAGKHPAFLGPLAHAASHELDRDKARGRFGWLGGASVEQQQTGRGERQLGAEEVGCTAGAPGIRSYIDYRAKGANDNLGSAGKHPALLVSLAHAVSHELDRDEAGGHFCRSDFGSAAAGGKWGALWLAGTGFG